MKIKLRLRVEVRIGVAIGLETMLGTNGDRENAFFCMNSVVTRSNSKKSSFKESLSQTLE